MLFKKFVTETKTLLEEYLQWASRMQAEGKLKPEGLDVLFPNILLASNCSGFFVVELIGATRGFKGLKVKQHKEKSIYRYLSQFDDTKTHALVGLDSIPTCFKFLRLAQTADFDAVK